ncbi:MAG: hypothetical protein ACRD9R_13110 [Pyrinomonadaceae bacterium]
MRLSEFITIYLAAAAPVGVSYFLNQQTRVGDTAAVRLAVKAVGVALLWPFTLAQQLSAATPTAIPDNSQNEETSSLDDEELDAGLRACLASLHMAEDRAHESLGERSQQVRHALLDACSSLERYVGLTRAASVVAATGEQSLTASEVELAKIAGREGADLETAGRCIRRRAMAKLRRHQANSRVELLHALAEIHEVIDRGYLAVGAERGHTRGFSEAILVLYERVIDLFRLLDDRAATQGAKRLLNAARARRHALDALDTADARSTREGDEACPAAPIPQQSNDLRLSSRTITLHG